MDIWQSSYSVRRRVVVVIVRVTQLVTLDSSGELTRG